MKKILVIHYSQTGQLTRVLDSILTPLKADASVSVACEELKPLKPFPFPWNSKEFFDAFPESVLEKPIAMQPLNVNPDEQFDLIILGCQVWFLSPSQPLTGFLKSKEGMQLLNGKNVITVSASRNMWLNAQESVKLMLKNAGAKLTGNIALIDRSPNLISVATIVGWLFYEKKENYLGVFPPSGISEKDIAEASRFGTTILEALNKNEFQNLQAKIVSQGGVMMVKTLVNLELRAKLIFRKWAQFISAKGGPGDPKRRVRTKIFAWYLPIGLLVLSPIAYTLSNIIMLLMPGKAKKQREYFEGVELN
ncbi:MAG: hypothetical protein POELPBGB_00450 [Bacteroidia bacterium]|nr:hypothetical protein [Bacteroidia bacterium]